MFPIDEKSLSGNRSTKSLKLHFQYVSAPSLSNNLQLQNACINCNWLRWRRPKLQAHSSGGGDDRERNPIRPHYSRCVCDSIHRRWLYILLRGWDGLLSQSDTMDELRRHSSYCSRSIFEGRNCETLHLRFPVTYWLVA